MIGAGLGLPGPVDQIDGVIGSSAILPGWVGVAAAEELRRRLDVPVTVDNDANLGALGELAYGAGRGATDMVYIKITSGIGAGLILDGRLYRGWGGMAGEFGHVLVDRRGRGLPLRQPRLPGDGRVDHRAARAAAPQPRRASRSPR